MVGQFNSWIESLKQEITPGVDVQQVTLYIV